MAFEIQVSVALVNTDPNVEVGEPAIVLRSRRSTSLVAADGDDARGTMALARQRFKSINEDVAVDFDGQLEIAERNAVDA